MLKNAPPGRKVFLILDGAADDSLPELGGRTPLEAAVTPHLDYFASIGEVGSAQTVPPEFTAASDVANLKLLGYDPRDVYTGRGPLEAAAMGIALAADEIAFRVNTISISVDDRLLDYSAGHIPTAESAEIVAAAQPLVARLGGALHAGVDYRHLMRRRDGLEARTAPPHDHIGTPIAELMPAGDLGRIVTESRALLRDHPVNARRRAAGKRTADALWPWGQGKAVTLAKIQDRFGVNGALVSAVDLIRGIGVLAGFRILQVPGLTGYNDSNHAGMAEHAIEALRGGESLAVIHVEAPDEAGHAKDVALKIQAIETIDREIVGRLRAALPNLALLAAPDHATHVATGRHGAGPVPYLLADATRPVAGPASFAERFAAGAPIDGGAPFARLMGLG